MISKKFYILCALVLGSVTVFAAQERSLKVQNSVRVGYDDNIYQNNSEQESAFITDIINLTGKVNFSSRTDLLVYWQPEFRYRFDAEPKFITYQDLYGRFGHAISERTHLEISDRFRYQDKEGQAGLVGDGNSNQTYFENDLKGALNFSLSSSISIQNT